MNRDEAISAITATLAEIAPEVDPATIDPAADLRVDLDLDSMDFLNLVIGVHERTGVDIPEQDYPRLATLDGFVAYLAAAPVT